MKPALRFIFIATVLMVSNRLFCAAGGATSDIDAYWGSERAKVKGTVARFR